MADQVVGKRTGSKGVPRPEREAEILDAAAVEFSERGYAATTAAIARRAGISKALVINHFRSKDDLYLACVERAGRELTTRTGAVTVQPSQSGLELAGDVVAAIFTALEPRPHDWRLLHDRTVPPDNPGAQAARRYRRLLIEQSSAAIVGSYSTTLTDSDDLSALIHVWRNTVTALVTWWLNHPDQTAADMIARARRLLSAMENSPS